MSGGISQTLRVGIANSLLRNTAWPAAFPSATVYVSLHTASPGTDGQAGNEISGSSYVAQTVTFSAPTAADPSIATSSSVVTYPTATTPGYTATHFGLWKGTGRTAADFIGGAALTASQAVAIGNTASFASTAITHTFTG